MLQFLILLTLIFFIECSVGIVAFLHRDQVRTGSHLLMRCGVLFA